MEYPHVLAPSMGCPAIISVKKPEIKVIIASLSRPKLDSGEKWTLTPSRSTKIPADQSLALNLTDIKEIKPDDKPDIFSLKEGWDIISRELVNRVFEGKAKVYKLSLSIDDSELDKMKKLFDGGLKNILYDLHYSGNHVQSKPHAVNLIEDTNKKLNFIHLTDLHLARRNDFIKEEIDIQTPIKDKYINFNDNFRDFIDDVNDKAKAGEVDFVFITGDIVDFVQLGVSEGTKGYDNNWQLFEEILIGSDSEDDRKNVSKNGKKISGITVPVYTSTGNHDWRTNPYDPSMSEGLSNSYGLTQKEMEHFDEEFYDSIDDIRNKENEVYQNLVRRKNFISETKENIVHYILKKILIMSDNWLAKSLFPIITWITGWTIIPAKELADYLVKTPHYVFASFLLILTAYTIHAGFNQLVAWLYRKYVIKGIISLEAGSSSLYHYFLHINPHFNHAFTFGANYFIMMDTGPDCLTGQYFWDRGNKKMRRVSISDNVLGGSPDSMAFYPANEYYTYGQIAILEQILTLIKSDNIPSDREKRIFVGVHAPPANLPKIPDYLNKRKGWDDPKQVPKYDFRVADDIRFGTINHYLSQFFYLCSGTKENDFSHDGPVVDMVLAGHAHWELEFRIKRYTEKITNSNHPDNDDKKKDKNDDDKVYIGKPYININIGNYSHWVKDNKDFNYKRPFLLQTAACGPMLGDFNKPPYYRLIQVKEDGTISGFKSNNGPSPEQKHKNWFEKLCDFDENSDFDENEEV